MCMLLNVPPRMEAEVADYERVTGESLQDMFLSYLESKLAARRVTDEKVMRQKARLLRCVGTWKDDRSTREIIADIESHRTMGRAVDL